MKRLLIFLAIASMATGAHAADPTTDMLNAPFVNDSITLSLGPGNDGKNIVKYTIDANNSPKTADGMTFRSSGEIAIHLQNLNPLTQAWVVEAKATPDVSFAAIKAFLDDLTALKAALPQPAGGPPSGGAGPRQAEDEAKVKAKDEDCDRLNKLITDAYKALIEQELTADELRSTVNGANGHAGVTTASTDFIAKQATIKENVKAARKALANIRAEFSSLDLPSDEKPEKTCDIVSSQILIDYIEVHSTADRIIAAKEALREQLGELVKILQPYLQQNVWRMPALSDYAIKTVNPTFAEQQNVSVTAKERTVQLVDNSIVVKSDDANVITGTFDVRKSSFFVAERAVAMIYNGLTYPQYGTGKNAAGATVVKRTDDHEPIDGAMMLNLVMRLGGGSVAYPFFQLGVSSAKEFPGFLAGVGFRFIAPFNFSLSVGGMITRYKDLDGDLKVDDVVSGTAEINEHLVYKTSPVAIYGAMQIKF